VEGEATVFDAFEEFAEAVGGEGGRVEHLQTRRTPRLQQLRQLLRRPLQIRLQIFQTDSSQAPPRDKMRESRYT